MLETFPALVSLRTAYILLAVCFGSIALFHLLERRYFRRHHDPKLRRKVYWWSTSVQVIISVALYLLLFGVGLGLTFGVITVFLSYYSIRNTRVCEACGKINRDFWGMGPVDQCGQCNVSLDIRSTV